MVKDDTTPIVVGHGFVNVVVFNFLCPDFGSGNLFSVQPDLGKGWCHGSEELSKDLGVFANVGVVFRNKRSRAGHDVAAYVSTGTNGRRSDIHDGRDNGLERSLHDSVHLEALSGSGSKVTLSV